MRITTKDLRRAITAGGDISSFAALCRKALADPPVDSASLIKQTLALPSPYVLAGKKQQKLIDQLSSSKAENCSANPSALSKAEMTLLPLAPFGKNSGHFLEGAIDRIKPDIIVVDAGQIEFCAQLLWAFSLPAALGLPLQGLIQHRSSSEVNSNRIFYPGNLCETAILKSWLNQIPLLPAGPPPKAKRLEFVAEQGWLDLDSADDARWEACLLSAHQAFDRRIAGVSEIDEALQIATGISQDLIRTSGDKKREAVVNSSAYLGSRLLDVAAAAEVQGRKARILAVTDLGYFTDLRYILDLLSQGILEETYTPPKPERELRDLVLAAQTSDQLQEDSAAYLPESTLSQERFNIEMERFVDARETEILGETEADRLIVEIAARTRRHPDIACGVSVRGAIAFHEIVNSLSDMHSGLTRNSIAKGAAITLAPRITLKQPGRATAIVDDLVKEVLWDIRFSGPGENSDLFRGSQKFTAADVLATLTPLLQAPAELDHSENSGRPPAVVSETDQNQQTLKHLAEQKFLKKDQQGQYQLTKKALEFLQNELDRKLEGGEITPEEYQHQKSALMKALQNISKPQFQISSRELANTVMEMMDAQDKLWEREVNFSTLHVYYHVKENTEGAGLIPQKRDYQALKRLIDDLDKRKILAAAAESSGFILTGLALNLLLKYLIDSGKSGKNSAVTTRQGKALASLRKTEVRRYTTGDAFRDISVRHTLKAVVKQKKNLADVRNCDFRVFLKQPRKPQSDIIICLDTSGSMGFHQKMTYARLAAAGLAQAAFEEGNRVGLVAFNDYGQVTVPLTSEDRSVLLDRIAASSPRGNTNIGDGMKASVDLLFQSPSSNQKYIVLITDGQPTAISEDAFARLKEVHARDLTEESTLLETRRACARGARVSVIHIASESESSGSFIRDIARAGKGQVRRVSKSSDLKAVMK